MLTRTRCLKIPILAILNAGRRAQSAKNGQLWRFIAVTNKSLLQKLSKLGQFADHMAGAALGVCILTTDPASRYSVLFDAGQAAAYMQLEALELGVESVFATIYEYDQARKLLCFPADWHLRVAISFGYPSEEDALTRPPKKGGRSPLSDVIHWNTWESMTCDE